MADDKKNLTSELNALDCISRQAATDALKVAYWDTDIQMAKDDPCIVDAMTDWAIRQIKALPSAQQWIPVSERLPEVENNVAKRVIVTTSWNVVCEAHYCVDHWEMNDIDYKLSSVIAWMPLPEPFVYERNEKSL